MLFYSVHRCTPQNLARRYAEIWKTADGSGFLDRYLPAFGTADALHLVPQFHRPLGQPLNCQRPYVRVIRAIPRVDDNVRCFGKIALITVGCAEDAKNYHEVARERGVGRGRGVGKGLGVGVGLGPCTSNEPISILPFTTRSKPGPR
jgi:hypothetical protein